MYALFQGMLLENAGFLWVYSLVGNPVVGNYNIKELSM